MHPKQARLVRDQAGGTKERLLDTQELLNGIQAHAGGGRGGVGEHPGEDCLLLHNRGGGEA